MPATPKNRHSPNAASASQPSMLYLIKQVELVIRSRLDDVVRPAGLTALQYTALTALESSPNLTSAQLARNSFVTAQTMADMIIALENRGLLDRSRDPSDRRRLVLTLTAEARRVLGRYRTKVAALESEMLTGFSSSQVAELRASLLACRSALASG